MQDTVYHMLIENTYEIILYIYSCTRNNHAERTLTPIMSLLAQQEYNNIIYNNTPLWSTDRSHWIQIQRSRVQFPVLPDFQRTNGSVMGSTQPCDDNWGTT
jgi:hypothetical protein